MAMIEVTFIGTGSALPPPGRGNACFTIRTEKMLLLADAGPSVWGDLQRAEIAPGDIDTIFLSHGHADHVLGFPQLALQAQFFPPKQPVRVLCTAAVREAVCTITHMTFPEANEVLEKFQWIELTEAEGLPQIIDLTENIQVTFQRVLGPVYMPVLGFRMDFFDADASLAFSADTRYVDDFRFVSIARNCDLLIHDAFISSNVQTNASPAEMVFHSSVGQAAQTAARANVKRLALMHRSLKDTHRQALIDEAAEYFKTGDILVPNDGDIVRLDKIE
jgi:ribonuclease Z